MKKLLAICLLAILAALFAGCDDDDNDSAGGDADTDADADADADADSDADGPFTAASDIVGSWAQSTPIRGNAKVKLTNSPNPITAGFTATITSLLTIEASGDGFTAKTRICDLATDIVPMPGVTAEISLPAAFYDAMQEEARPITVADDGTVTLAAYTEVMGLDVNNFDKENDPMPAQLSGDAAGAALLDQDGDGLPGITGHMKASVKALNLNIDADLYVVQRDTTTINAKFDDINHISGTCDWTLEMSVLGVKQKAMEPVVKLLEKPEITQSTDASKKSVSRMMRIADGATCADVKAVSGTAFADGPYAN